MTEPKKIMEAAKSHGIDAVDMALAIDEFARLLAEDMQPRDAFKRAFDVEKSRPIEYYKEAEALASSDKVQRLVARHKARAAEEREEKMRAAKEAVATYDLRQAMADTRMAYEEAAAKGNAGAMVAAATLMSKLHGLLVDRQEVKTGPLKGLSDEELDAEIARMQAAIAIEKAADGR